MKKSFVPKYLLPSWQTDTLSLDTFHKLSDIFFQIVSMKPWRSLGDREIIGVEDSISGDAFYNVFMGSGGTMFGVSTYRGDLGYSTYRRALSTKELEPNEEWPLQQDTILSTLEMPDQMYPDMQLFYRYHNLPLDRARAYPSFIAYEPELFPSVISETQGQSLLSMLAQVCDVTRRLLDGELKDITKPKRIFFRSAEKTNNAYVWRDEWRDPPPKFNSMPLRTTEATEAELITTLAQSDRNGSTWEVDYFLEQEPLLDERGRPMFFRVGFVVDSKSYFIMDTTITPRDAFGDTLLRGITKAAHEHGVPNVLRVKRQELFDLLQPPCATANVHVEIGTSLPAINCVKRDFRNAFKNRKLR